MLILKTFKKIYLIGITIMKPLWQLLMVGHLGFIPCPYWADVNKFLIVNRHSSSLSSCRAAGTDIPDPLSPFLPIVHPLWQVQGYIPYPYIAAVCMFELVILLLPGHMWMSIGVYHVWARPYFSRKCPAYLVCLAWIVFVIGGRWP